MPNEKMTTFTTKNQSRKRYYRGLAALAVIIVLVAFIILSRRDRNNVSTNKNSQSLSQAFGPSSHRDRNNNNKYDSGSDGRKRPAPFYNPDTVEFEPVIALPNQPRLQIKGQVRMAKDADGIKVASFLGVPYAEPPVDDRRLRPPQDRHYPANVTTTIDAFYQPARCYQNSYVLSITEMKFTSDETKEDCLYLNIWVPYQNENGENTTTAAAGMAEKKLPVMVFIHGGLFQFGGIGSNELDASTLAAKMNLVVVTIQHRLGLFGFGSTDADSASDSFRSYGLQDQAKALEWVHGNIGAFGGDARRITVAGHGAGAISVGFHLMDARVNKLFRRAIIQGVHNIWNVGIYGLNAKSVRFLMEDSNCDDDSVNVRDVLACIKNTRIQPIVFLDGQQYLIDAFPVPFVPEFNPATRKAVKKIHGLPANLKFNDTMLETVFAEWNIFAPDHEILIGLNSDDDYQLEKVNKVNTKLRFGQNEYDEDEEEEEEEEGGGGEEEEEEGGGAGGAGDSTDSGSKEETEDEEPKKPTTEEAAAAAEEEETMDAGEEIVKTDTSNDNDADDGDQDGGDQTPATTTTMDHLATQRRRRRRRRQAEQTGQEQQQPKLDKDEIVKLCRLAKMYQLQRKRSGPGSVTPTVAMYRIDPKVLVNLLEEVSFAFGAKANWLVGLRKKTMHLWGSFATDGIKGLKELEETLAGYPEESALGPESVSMVNVGQAPDDENRSHISQARFDWNKLCAADTAQPSSS